MRNIVSPLEGIRSPFGPRYGGFSPASLFAAGEQGVWYDPSDFSTMFQDVAGTTPVTAVEQPVGRILDKSGRGNHATQSTTASRPVLSARVNQLTYSEDQSNGAWVNYNATQQSNVGVAPNGTNTADRIVEAAGASIQARYQQNTGGLNIPYTVSVYAKADQRNVLNLSYSGTGGGFWFAATFELTGSGTVTKTGAGASGTYTNSSIISVGNGWYFCQITGSTGQATTHYAYSGPSNTTNPTYGSFGTLTYSGSTSNGVLVWGFDLRPVNQTTLLPAYQRIATATDYDTTGFPYYLKFDGVDDSMATGTITPGINKVQAFSGVRKQSDAAGHIAGGNGNVSGQFEILSVGWSVNANRYGAGFYTNIVSQIDSPANFTPPRTDVLSWRFDTGGATGPDKAKLNVNGVAQTLTISGLPTGANFGAFAHYIGRRDGTSLPFPGNLYSLIVRFGSNLDATTISNTETWVNGKTLAY